MIITNWRSCLWNPFKYSRYKNYFTLRFQLTVMILCWSIVAMVENYFFLSFFFLFFFPMFIQWSMSRPLLGLILLNEKVPFRCTVSLFVAAFVCLVCLVICFFVWLFICVHTWLLSCLFFISFRTVANIFLTRCI